MLENLASCRSSNEMHHLSILNHGPSPSCHVSQIPINAKITKPDMKLTKHSIVVWLRKFLFSKGCCYCCLACVFECEVFLQRCKNIHQNLLIWHCRVKFSWKSKCRLGLSNLSKWPVIRFMTQQKYQIHQFLDDPY